VDSINVAQSRGQWVGSYRQDNGSIRCIKDGKFPNRLRQNQFLKEGSVPLSQTGLQLPTSVTSRGF
jgi:hypothetical protein